MTGWHDQERDYMRMALDLACRRAGFVEPNPMVGCVLTKDQRIIGRGCHEHFGGDHAEVAAIKSTACDPAGSTAYVTLEPCAHFGKTPPCVDALLKAQVARVVIANLDPNPTVSGRGVDRLRAAGVEVHVGLLSDEAAELNAPFFKRMRFGLPWIIAKWAMSLDGKIATRSGESKWISCEASRKDAHQLRGRVDAILVGIGTVLADDPLLTARPTGPRIARRIVLDSTCRLPLSSQLVRTAKTFPTIVVCQPDAPAKNRSDLESAGVEVWTVPGKGRDQFESLFKQLAKIEVTNVLVEGGAQVLGALAQNQLVDEVQAYVAPILIGGSTAPSPLGGAGLDRLEDALRLKVIEHRQIETDLKIIARRNSNSR